MPKSASRKRRPLYLSLLAVLVMALSGCNLLTAPNNSQTVISGLPIVQIAAPPPNATFLENVAVNIQVLVSNAGADIDRVEFVVDGTTVQTLKSPNTGGAASFSLAQAWTATGIGQHTLGVTAFRADGSSSAPANVTVSVVSQDAQIKPTATTTSQTNTNSQGNNNNGNGQAQPTAVPPTSAPAQPTNTQPPAATATPNKPTATFLQGVNVRSGPSTKFNPPIGSFATGQTTDIVARTPAGDWYKVKYYNGEGWVFSQLMTVSGDEAQIVVDAGPAVPTDTPVPTVPPPSTAVPVNNQVNLVAGLIRLDPAQPKCGQTFNIFIDVANQGSQANTSGGSISVSDTRAADGSNPSNTVGAFGIIQPGQTVNSGPIPITVSTNYEDDHKLTLVVDSGNAVAETNEGDNTATFTYRLPKANCP